MTHLDGEVGNDYSLLAGLAMTILHWRGGDRPQYFTVLQELQYFTVLQELASISSWGKSVTGLG